LNRSLSGLDAAFLAVETDTTPMHMTGLVTLAPSADGLPASFAAIREHLAPRLETIPIFRRHLAGAPLGLDRPVWVERPFDLDAHVHRLAVPAPGGPRELAEVVGHLAALPLDRSRPLWALWVIEGLADGRTGVLTKLHHALMDGVAGAEIFARLFDTDPAAPAEPEPTDASRPPVRGRAPSALRIASGAARALATAPYRMTREVLGSALAGLRALRNEPRGAAASTSLAAPDTPLNGAITARREVALASVSLAELRALRARFGVKLNDVVLAVCAGALRRALGEAGVPMQQPLVAALPVSVSQEQGRTAGNRISAMLAELPVHLADPVARVASVHRSTRRAKRMHAAVGKSRLSGWAEAAPPALLSGLSSAYSRLGLADRHPPLVNLIVSNVPGPDFGLFCAGHRIESCHPLGPIYEGCALNLTVLSYDGALHFGLLSCPDVGPALDRIAEALEQSVAELGAAGRCLEPKPLARAA
jgi:WS/DGAT/MGAT family acyltransferase